MEDPLGYGLGALSYLASVALSVTEGALSDFSWTKLEAIAEGKKVSAKIGRYLKREDDIVLAASSLKVAMNVFFVLMAVHLCVVGAVSTAATYVVAVASMAGIILLADVPAYLVGRRLAEPLLVRTLPALNAIRFVLQPALWASRFVGEIASRVLGYHKEETPAESFADDILSAATEGRREGVIREEEHDMIEGIIHFKEREISDVMTPRTDMAMLSVEVPAFEAAKYALEKGYSRIPIYRETTDDVVGILHVRDLLPFLDKERREPPPLEELSREPFFTPETSKIADLFGEMRAKKIHMALVLDEFGGTAGLVTMEDILEEIVGEIEDEYDPEPQASFRRQDERTAIVDGRLRIEDLNEQFQLQVPENDGYDTVGGFLCSVFGRVPKQGEAHQLGPVEFTVMDADPRKVLQVQVMKECEA